MYTYRSDVLPNDQQHPQQRAHQVRRDSNTDTASTTSTDDSSSLSPPPPPPPRRSNDADQSPLRGPWVHFDSRNVSWASTFDNTSSSGSDDGSDAESSFHDNESPTDTASSPVVITASANGSGWEVQQPPTAAPAVHADHAAQIIGDRVRRMLQQKQNDDRTVHQKQKLTQQKQKHDEALRRKQLAVEEGISNDENASHSSKYCPRAPSARTCLLSAIAVIFLLCGALGIALVVVSRKGDSNNMSAFGELDIGHSGPPLDDAYDGGAGGPSDGAAGDDASGDDSNIIDEVGEEGYYNDEDDDGIPDGYEGYSGDEYDFIVTGEPTSAPSRAPASARPTRRPTNSPPTASIFRPIAPSTPRPTPGPTRRPTTRRPTRAPTRAVANPNPNTSGGKEVSPHNQYSVPKKYETEFDGHILVPERRRNTLFLFDGGKQPADRRWDDAAAPWSLRLYPRHLWQRSNSINDVKRVVHKGRIHIAVCGSGGNAVALYDFESKRAKYWSNTCGSAPHDVEYLPLGGGYMAVASSRGRFSTINLYEVSGGNNQGCISGAEVRHNGVHSLHWDAKQKLLWAWGSDTIGLVSYRVRFGSDGSPRLARHKVFQPDVPNFKVATGHGGSPMIANGRRYLLLAGDMGILRFDTESHEWSVERSAPDGIGVYSNPKGISYKQDGSGEIIMAKSNSRVYSTHTGQRQILEADIYKARWWQHNAFSYDPKSDGDENANAAALRPAKKPAPTPAKESTLSSDYLVGAYYFIRSSTGQQFLRNQLQPSQPPVLGDYDGTKPNVIGQHLEWSREASINLWVTGWRGPDTKEDRTIRDDIMKHPNLPGTKIALLYQTNTRIDLRGDSSLDSIYSDVEYIARTYFDNPNYLRLDGRPVLYLYLSRVLHGNFILEQVVELMRQAAADNGGHDVYIIGDQAFGEAPRPGVSYDPFELLDSVTNYDVYGDIRRVGYAQQDGVVEYTDKQRRWHDAALASANCDFIPSVTPGFNDGPNHSPLSRQVHESADPGSLFRRLLDNALDLAGSSHSRMVMITSWNGFHDDTQIEPVLEAPVTRQATGAYNEMQLNYQGYGKLFLNIVRQTVLRKKRMAGQR